MDRMAVVWRLLGELTAGNITPCSCSRRISEETLGNHEAVVWEWFLVGVKSEDEDTEAVAVLVEGEVALSEWMW